MLARIKESFDAKVDSVATKLHAGLNKLSVAVADSSVADSDATECNLTAPALANRIDELRHRLGTTPRHNSTLGSKPDSAFTNASVSMSRSTLGASTAAASAASAAAAAAAATDPEEVVPFFERMRQSVSDRIDKFKHRNNVLPSICDPALQPSSSVAHIFQSSASCKSASSTLHEHSDAAVESVSSPAAAPPNLLMRVKQRLHDRFDEFNHRNDAAVAVASADSEPDTGDSESCAHPDNSDVKGHANDDAPPRGFLDKMLDGAAEISESIRAKKSSIASRIAGIPRSFKARMHERWRSVESKIKVRLYAKLEDKLDEILEGKIKASLRQSFVDDAMAQQIHCIADTAFESAWLDIREELWNSYYESKIDAQELDDERDQMQYAPQSAIAAESSPPSSTSSWPSSSSSSLPSSLSSSSSAASTCTAPPVPERAGAAASAVTTAGILEQACPWYRYHNHPFDRTSWQSMWDPVWLSFRTMRLVPLFGLSFWSFLLEFIFMDRTDEYQLIRFILDIKGTQFISVAIVPGWLAFWSYYRCVNWASWSVLQRAASDAPHSCEIAGSGNRAGFMWELLLFFLQLCLAWAALLLLPRATKKGQRVVADSQNSHGRIFRRDISATPFSIKALLRPLLRKNDAESNDEDSQNENDRASESDSGDSSEVDIASPVGNLSPEAPAFSAHRDNALLTNETSTTISRALDLAHDAFQHTIRPCLYSSWRAIGKYRPDFGRLLHSDLNQHGLLSELLNMDVVAFALLLICAAIFLLLRPYSILGGNFDSRWWQFAADMAMLKILYGLCSFPFLIFLTPIAPIFLHLRPTGYTKDGACVPLRVKREKLRRQLRHEAEAKLLAEKRKRE